MRTLSLASCLILAACSASAEQSTPAVAPDGTALHGGTPVDGLAVPDFAVTDHLGNVRGPQDLQGRPHVLWFYPMAGTPG